MKSTFSRGSNDTIGICLWVDAVADGGGDLVAVVVDGFHGRWQVFFRADTATMLEIELVHQRLQVERDKQV